MELAFKKMREGIGIPKTLEQARGVKPKTGTYEFAYEEGPRAQKLYNLLSSKARGYHLVDFESLTSSLGYSIDRYVIGKIDSGLAVGELEVMREHSGKVTAAFLCASNREIARIAEIALSCE